MKKILIEKTKYHEYAFTFSFDENVLRFCQQLKASYPVGSLSFYESKWRFTDLGIAWLIKNQFEDVELDDSIVQPMLTYKVEKEKDSLKAKIAENIKQKEKSSIKLKNVKGELYDFQKIGVEFFDNNDGNAILADQMGAGKTAQAISYAAHKGFEKILVICPASLKYNWAKEVKKWTHLSSVVLKSSMIKKEGETTEVLKMIQENNVIIINYDSLRKFLDLFCSLRWDIMIVDECHMIKSNTAQRTKYVKELARRVPRKILLSGTPMLSRPVELFNSLHMMDPKTWNNYYSYTRRYCGGYNSRWGYDVSGATNIEELRDKISRYFLRRTKEEVLKDLPPKQFSDIEVDLSVEDRFKYDLAMEDFKSYLTDVKKKKDEDVERSLAAENLVRVNELRTIASKGKIDAAIELIQNIIESGEKVLVFSNFNDPLEKMHNHFKLNSFLLTGKTDEFIRQTMVDEFQSNPEKKIFFGGIKSAGVGITLTAASNVIFLDYSWLPSDHAQAMDRAHRIGTKAESINVYQLIANDTIDQYVKEVLEEKQEIFDKLFNGKDCPEAEEAKQVNLFDAVMKKIKKDI